MSEFGVRFGQLIRKHREAQGLSAMELAEEAFGDQAKRSRISELENGKVNNPQAKTISALQVYLNIPQEEVDACRQPVQAQPSTEDQQADDAANNEFAMQIVDKLSAENRELAKQAGVKEERLKGIAKRIIKDDVSEDQAIREFDRLVEAEILREKQTLSNSNFGIDFDAILNQMDEYSSADEDDKASELADQTLFDRKELREREDQATIKLLEAALQTDLLRRDATKAASRIMEKAEIEFPDFTERFDQLRAIQIDWFRRGKQMGTLIDLEVSEQLARHYTATAKSHEQKGTALNDRAIALRNLGERASGEEGLEFLKDAVRAYDLALEIYTRETMPADWAMTQMNRANAFLSLGERASDEEGLKTLKDAVKTYDLALEVFGEPGMEYYAEGTRHNRAIALAALEKLKPECS